MFSISKSLPHRGNAAKNDCLCTICGRQFELPWLLRKHMKLHDEPKEVCQICGKKFFLKKHLTAHMETHDPVKKHRCPVCDTAFQLKGNMQQHLRRVHGPEHMPPKKNLNLKYECDHCEMAFHRGDHLDRHLKIRHNINYYHKEYQVQ